MFTAVPFKTAHKCREPKAHPLEANRHAKPGVEHYLATRKNEILIDTPSWMDLVRVGSEKGQHKRPLVVGYHLRGISKEEESTHCLPRA